MATKKAVKPAVKAAPVGRPSAYKPEYAEQGRKLCLLGFTDGEMADFFGVSEQTLNAWKTAHPEFLESIRLGKVIADSDIAESLYHRAKGYSHPEVDIKVIQNQIVETHLIKHYPPDTTAASLWLRNRQGGRWRDKTEQEITGKDGAPIDFSLKVSFV
jgi:hypothetical protein